MLIVKQNNFYVNESFAVRMAARDAGYDVLNVSDTASFPSKPFMPVGSVEFCMAAMRHQHIDVSHGFPPYPERLIAMGFLLRNVEFFSSYKKFRESEHGEVFIKPNWPPKSFDCYILSASNEIADETVKIADDESPVWVSELVTFLSEWRYYIARGAIVGAARYDDGLDDAPVPDFDVVNAAVLEMNQDAATPAGYVLDFGVLSDGRTALVEANDGWAVGLYSGDIKRFAYLDMLLARWQQIQRNYFLY